jgi:hypothetical protein
MNKILLEELYAAVPSPKHSPIKITPDAVGTILSPLRGQTNCQTNSLQRNFFRRRFAPGPDQSALSRETSNARLPDASIER